MKTEGGQETRRVYLDRDLAMGDKVWVYEDPITQLKVEGRATVMRIKSQRAGGCRAQVRFDDAQESFPVERFIAFPLCEPA